MRTRRPTNAADQLDTVCDVTVADPEAFHRQATVVDTHNDLLMLVASRPVEEWVPYFRGHWLPQLRAGGVDVQVLPVFVDEEYRPEGAMRMTLRMIEAAHRLAAGCPEDVAICHDGTDVERVAGSGRIALLLALEGCFGVDSDVELLETLFRLGVRMASFTHFGRTALADGSGEDATGGRLTRAGVAAMSEMERLRMIVDVSHLGRASLDHVLELATAPVIATHSSARALRDHHRNLDDTQIRDIAETGGVVCVNFFPGFLAESAATVEHLADHLEHVVGVAGLDHVGIGPDFCKEIYDERFPSCESLEVEGINAKAVLPGLDGPRGLPLLTRTLASRGWKALQLRAVLGENVLGLFRSCLPEHHSEASSLRP